MNRPWGLYVLLPRGVTGIYSRKGTPLPASDYAAFRGHCYAAARGVGGTVLRVEGPRQDFLCNYAIAVVRFRGSDVAILLNEVYPLVAFARSPADGQLRLEFTDCPELAESLQGLGEYTVLSGEQLTRPLTREFCEELAPHEVKRVRYFRPQRVGDVIFNWWD